MQAHNYTMINIIYSSYMYTNTASAIHDITQNFQIGFGSFVDKRRVPYISIESARSVNELLEY